MTYRFAITAPDGSVTHCADDPDELTRTCERIQRRFPPPAKLRIRAEIVRGEGAVPVGKIAAGIVAEIDANRREAAE